MNRPAAVVFDYGGTLVESKVCKFEEGIKKLLSLSVNPGKITSKEILNTIEDLGGTINAINKDYLIEIGFRNYFKYVFGKFNIEFNDKYEELEKIFRQEIYEYKPTHGVKDLLGYLKSSNIRIGVLSNNEFSGEALEYELRTAFPDTEFEFVISSVDYYFRKPSPKIFEIAESKLDLHGTEIWYVGDNFSVDVIGSSNAGFTPVWYNQYGKVGYKESNYIEAASWSDLIKFIDNLEA